MTLKAGPYENAKAARTALWEAGYLDTSMPGTRPQKWVNRDLRKTSAFAVQILRDGQARIVPYPNLKRIDYRVTSDAERASQAFRTSLSRPRRKRPRA